MKNLAIIVFILALNYNYSLSQPNMIYNPGFENAKPGRIPQCSYGANDYIDDDIADWANGKCSSIFYCVSKHSWPDWVEPSAQCFAVSGLMISTLPYYSRFVRLVKNADPDVVRTGLITNMNPSKKYLFKIVYTSVDQTFNSYSQIKVVLSKYNKHWYRSWGNSTMSYTMYPPSYTGDGVNIGG